MSIIIFFQKVLQFKNVIMICYSKESSMRMVSKVPPFDMTYFSNCYWLVLPCFNYQVSRWMWIQWKSVFCLHTFHPAWWVGGCWFTRLDRLLVVWHEFLGLLGRWKWVASHQLNSIWNMPHPLHKLFAPFPCKTSTLI